MIDDFMYVLENYPDVNLASEDARRKVATALVNYMCEHHIISYTDLDAVRKDPVMMKFIENFSCNITKDNNQMELPLERGL